MSLFRRIAGYLANRASTLDQTEVHLFAESDVATQKLLNIIAILRTDRLFFEFLFEVYREKVILGIPTMGANKDIGKVPIVCSENDFKNPCRGPDYSNFAFKLLKEFGVSNEQLGFFLLDEPDNFTPSDSHPPMRILRRNFATVLQACTDMSLEEKEYIFGHRISGKDGAKKRIEYSRNMIAYGALRRSWTKLLSARSFMSPTSLKSPWVTVS